MFEEEAGHGWPPILNFNVAWPGEHSTKLAGHHTCYYCGQRGHWNRKCASPHLKCHEKLRCVVPLSHPTFIKACEYGGRTKNNNAIPDANWTSEHKRKHENSPSSPAVNTGLPPADSLLFSPLDPLAQTFRPSHYQATPPPGTWGNAPWGTSWAEAANRAPSPCIFDYSRGGSEPLYLSDTGTRTAPGHTDLTESTSPEVQGSPVSTGTHPFPQDFGMEDLSQYAEVDLPGAVYPDDDNPLAPTAHNVSYRPHNSPIQNLGIWD